MRLPGRRQTTKLVAAWLVSNLLWTLVSGGVGLLTSGLLKAAGVLDNPYALVGVACLIAAAALVIVRPAWRRLRVSGPPIPHGRNAASTGAISGEPNRSEGELVPRTQPDLADPLGDEGQKAKGEKASREAESQLAAAIRAGHVLSTDTAAGLPLAREWLAQTTVLVKEAVGELEAARLPPSEGVPQRLDRLDDLADQVKTSDVHLVLSEAWAAHAQEMQFLSRSLALRLEAGKGLRKQLFESRAMDPADATLKVKEWRETLDLTVRAHGRALGEMLVADGSRPSGVIYRHTGMTSALSAVVTRLEQAVLPLEAMLQQVDAYAKSLSLPRNSAA